MFEKIIFPGSFKPFTRGHLFVITNALELRLTQNVLVTVADKPLKNPIFTRENAAQLVRFSLSSELINHVSIEISSFETAARKHNVYTMVRGIRDRYDHDFEKENARKYFAMAARETSMHVRIFHVIGQPSNERISSAQACDIICSDSPSLSDLQRLVCKDVADRLMKARVKVRPVRGDPVSISDFNVALTMVLES
jgi:cytidyltransferase-like protein